MLCTVSVVTNSIVHRCHMCPQQAACNIAPALFRDAWPQMITLCFHMYCYALQADPYVCLWTRETRKVRASSFSALSGQPMGGAVGCATCHACYSPLMRRLHCTALHCTALHCTALHCTSLPAMTFAILA